MSVVGASRFLNSATLTNTRGISPASTNLLDNISNSLLDAGRRINRSGIGLSKGARANLKRLQNSAADFNALFSLGGGGSTSIEAVQTQILALRAQTPTNRLSREVRETIEDVNSEPINEALEEEQDAAEADDASSSDTSSVLSNGSVFDSTV